MKKSHAQNHRNHHNRVYRRLGSHSIERLEKRDVFAGLPELLAPSLAISATEYQESRILVRFQSDAAVSFNALNGTRLGENISAVPDLFEVDLENGTSVSAALAAYRSDSRVLYAEPDARVSASLVSNDPGLGSLWGLNNTGQAGGTADADIDAAEAWDLVSSETSVVVAVIDSGIDYNHQDLKGNIWVNADELVGNGVDDDRNGFIDDIHGWDFVNGDSSPLDDNGHGTHVAGTIGAVRNNGIGIAGVASNVKLMALKFLDAEGAGYLSDAISAIDYAWQNGARIANNSWGGGGYSQSLADAVERFRKASGIFVVAAGNEVANNDVLPSFPANFSHNNIVSVAASDRLDQLASFSNYGTAMVDVVAPGASILSTTPNNTYSTMDGTSMATPHVTGALAAIWGQHPIWTYRQVIEQMLQSTDPVLTDKVAYGRLNLAKALGTNVDSQGPTVVTADWLGSATTNFNRIRVTFNEAVIASTFTIADISLQRSGASVAVTGVTQVSDRVFDITLSTQSTAGVYTLTVGPNVRDLAGNLMNQDGDATPGESIQDQFKSTLSLNQFQTYTWSGSARIYDYSATTVSVNVPADVVIADLNVKVNIAHTYDGDVRIYLIDPSGSSRQLFNRRGGSGDNIYATFDDEASTSIVNGKAPFNGSFRPETSLSVFDGKRATGTWQIRVEDVLGGYTGSIYSASLIIQSGATPIAQNSGALTLNYPIATAMERVWGKSIPTPSITFGTAVDSTNVTRQSDHVAAESSTVRHSGSAGFFAALGRHTEQARVEYTSTFRAKKHVPIAAVDEIFSLFRQSDLANPF